jgi:hypothetical protein
MQNDTLSTCLILCGTDQRFFEFEDSYPLGCNAVPLGKCLSTSQRNMVPSPSGSSSLRSSSLKQSRMIALPWKWRYYVPLKHQDLLTQRQSITFMKTWTLNYATVRTSNLLNFILWAVPNLHRWLFQHIQYHTVKRKKKKKTPWP